MSEATWTAEVRTRLARLNPGEIVARYGDLIAVALLIWGLFFYLNNIDGWLINDDEGSYLYAAWRISQGELPYRDFLTPQLPVFLYSGALLIKLFGPSVLALRTVSAWLSLLSVALLYLTARRLFRREVALIAALAFLMHPDLYLEGRVYRPEPYMLFFAAAGLYAFVEATFGHRRWLLVVAGLLFGVGTLAKLFVFLPLVACVAFLGYQALRGETTWPDAAKDIAALVVPYGLVVVGVLVGFYLLVTPAVAMAVFGHHLMQGRGLSRWAIFVKGLVFYVRYVQEYGLLVAFAVPAAIHALVGQDRRRWLFAWQVPTALAFLLLSRELWARHLLYLVPGLSMLFALALEPMLTWPRRSYLLLALVVGLTIPWYLDNRDIAWRSETGTWRLADFIAAHTAPNHHVLADYSGLNFYARRKSTYSGTSLSAGATRSGQITARRLIEEMQANDVKMVIVDQSQYSHLRFLHDRALLERYLEEDFRLLGTFWRNHQVFNIYWTKDQPFPGLGVNFENGLTLLSGNLMENLVESGGQVEVRLRWQAQEDLRQDYIAFLHLEDQRGHLWGQGDGPLIDSRERMTSGWDPGEINVDRYTLQVLPGTPPGEYQLHVGLYRRNVLSRVNIVDAVGNPVGTEYALGTLQVTRPASPASPETLEIPRALQADLGDTVRLLGYGGLGEETVRAGDTVSLSLFWQALRDIPTNYSLRLQLRDAEGRLAASQLLPPAGDAFPTSQWRQGDVIRGRYDLLVDATASAGRYQLVLNWVEADTGQPLAEADIPLGQVEVTQLERQFQVPSISTPLRADLGERIAFLGYDLGTPQVEPGGTVRLTLYWQARGQMKTSYTVFTHLLDERQRIRGQRDSLPAEGARPTTGWLPGEVITDEYAIPVDPDAPPGEYVLEIGMYDALTGERLPVVMDGVRVPGDRILLAKVEVR